MKWNESLIPYSHHISEPVLKPDLSIYIRIQTCTRSVWVKPKQKIFIRGTKENLHLILVHVSIIKFQIPNEYLFLMSCQVGRIDKAIRLEYLNKFQRKP